nr:hypothetical protein [Escherichia coli]
RSHASTLKSPSYTKSVSWQHYRNADGNCLTGLFNVSKNIQHVNITNLHGRDLISEVDILGNEITLRPWQVMWIK